MPPASPPMPTPPASNDYSFIMSPSQPPKRVMIPGSSSFVGRLLVVLGGLLVLAVLFAIIKSSLGGSSNQTALLSVVQDQQEIIHLTTAAGQSAHSQQINLSSSNQNFAVTARLTFTTAEQQLITYMKNNHMKVSNKQLVLKESAATDSQLSAAATAGTYDSTFTQVMQNELTTYKQDLTRAFNLTKGPKGRQLLSNDFNYANLLLSQLGSPSS